MEPAIRFAASQAQAARGTVVRGLGAVAEEIAKLQHFLQEPGFLDPEQVDYDLTGIVADLQTIQRQALRWRLMDLVTNAR